MNLIESFEFQIFSEEMDPETLHASKTYLNEAKWGWLIIAPEVNLLPVDSTVLEVGAGSQALTAQVASQNLRVTALEPSSVGFSIMKTLGEKVFELANDAGIHYNIVDTTGEQFEQVEEFDFAFSINVMEHVGDINSVLDNVVSSLKVGGKYQFICPNYRFPFEPHFNVPTLVNKRLTDLLIRRTAIKHSKAIDPEGLWSSLNWISIPHIKRWAKNTENVSVEFSNRALEMYAARSRSDAIFIERHKFISKAFSALYPLMLIVIRNMPISLSPFIDVKIVKLK